MRDLNNRIQQLTKLILTSESQSVDEAKGEESRPASPSKIDFDMSPYQLQQELLNARFQIETQANQILSLEAALVARPLIDTSAPENEKDRLVAEQTKTIRELEIVVKGYEENLGEPLRAVREDVETEWKDKLYEEVTKREEKERWADELVKQLEKEKKLRTKLEDERRALAAFVSKFDSLGLGTPSKSKTPSTFAEKQQNKFPVARNLGRMLGKDVTESPIRIDLHKYPLQPSLLDQAMPEEQWAEDDLDFDVETAASAKASGKTKPFELGVGGLKKMNGSSREVLSDKENIVPSSANR
jgi:centromeric protein E